MENLRRLFFTKEGNIEDYNLVCPKCGAIYYERSRHSEEIIKSELYMYGKVREGHGPVFHPSCPECGDGRFDLFTAEDLKPRKLKGPGKVIKVKKGSIGYCSGGFTFINVDWDYSEEIDVEKEKLIKDLKAIKDSSWRHRGIWIYVEFPEQNTGIHFRMQRERNDVLESISVFGRVSREDAICFVEDLLNEVEK